MEKETQARLDRLKKHIENLKEIDTLREKYSLTHAVSKLNPYVVCSCRIRQKDLKKLLKLCSKKKKTQSTFIRELILKGLKGGKKE